MLLFNRIEINFYPRHEYRVLRELRTNGKIAAIRLYRDTLCKRKVSLQSARDYVYSVAVKHGMDWDNINKWRSQSNATVR